MPYNMPPNWDPNTNYMPPGYDPMQDPKAGMPRPRSDISQIPGQPGAPIADETPHESGFLQPGNRRSIKEYLEEIRLVRDQQRQMGVPENQLPVPTFTNIQGGQMDVSQGEMRPEGGMGPGQDVRSYVQPEYVQGKGGAGDLSIGPEHPKSQAERAAFQRGSAELEKIKKITNKVDPRYPMALSIQMYDQAYQQLEQTKAASGQGAVTPEEAQSLAVNLRNQAFEMQGEYISGLKKKFKDADISALWKAHETGNWGYAVDAGKNLLSQEKINKVKEDAYEEWRKYITDEKNMGQRPVDPDTQEPYPSISEYVNDAVNEYQEMISGMIEVSSEMSGSEVKPGAEKVGAKPTAGGPGGHDEHGKVIKTGTDRTTGKKVMMHEDGTVMDEEGNIIQ